MVAQTQPLSLDTIYIIPFLRSLQENDPKIISPDLSRTDFERLAAEFIDSDQNFESPIERRAHKRKQKIKLISSCLYYLSQDPFNQEILDVLKDNQINIDPQTYSDGLEDAYKKIQRLDFLMRQDISKTKKGNTPKSKQISKEKNSIFDMMTSLSTGLELSLDFSKMVVSEFISYKKALKRKQQILKNTTTKNKTNGKRK